MLGFLSNALSFSQLVEISNKFTCRLNSKNVHSMYIMWELPTNKANFLFKNMQDFNQTTHVGPQELNVFMHNISFYFHAIISVNNLMKQSCNSMSWLLQHCLKILSFEAQFTLQNAKCVFSTWSLLLNAT